MDRCNICGGVDVCPALHYADVITAPAAHSHRNYGRRTKCGVCGATTGTAGPRYHVPLPAHMIPPGYEEQTIGSTQSGRVKAHWPKVEPKWVCCITYVVLVRRVSSDKATAL
jgi:hypothetical protein